MVGHYELKDLGEFLDWASITIKDKRVQLQIEPLTEYFQYPNVYFDELKPTIMKIVNETMKEGNLYNLSLLLCLESITKFFSDEEIHDLLTSSDYSFINIISKVLDYSYYRNSEERFRIHYDMVEDYLVPEISKIYNILDLELPENPN